MANKTDKSNLGYLGEDFQYKLVHAFMEDKEFFKDLYDITDQNMFTNPNLKICVGVMKEYFEKHECPPSYETIDILLREKAHNPIDLEVFLGELTHLKSISSEDIDLVKELGTKFFRQQNIVKTANQILKIANDGVDDNKCEKYVELMSEALSKGVHSNYGADVTSNIDKVLSPDYRETIATGIDIIDDCLEGGIGKGELGVIACPSGVGKVQPYDAKIITPYGIKTMGEIKVGDYVIGKNGKRVKVVQTFPHTNWKFYKLTFTDGTSCECGKEHLWAVNTRQQRAYRKRINGKKVRCPDLSYKVMSLDDMMNYGLRSKTKKQEHNFRLPTCSPVEYEYRDISIEPYLLGYMIGDGNFARTIITIGDKDKEEILNIFQTLNIHYKYALQKHKNRADSIKLYQFKDDLKKYFDLSLTAKNKYIPEDYLYNTPNVRVELLQGLLDSDGTCNKKGQVSFNTKSELLAQNVRELVLSLGGYASISSKKCFYYSQKLHENVDCEIHYRVKIRFHEDNPIQLFKLSRKQKLVHYTTFKCGQGKYLDKVEFSRVADGQCILLDSEDHLYLTDDYIVTHNTSLTTAFASHAAIELNKKVVQIVFEDTDVQISRKHHARFVSKYGQEQRPIEAKDLSKEENREYVINNTVLTENEDLKTKYARLSNNLKFFRLPSGEVTAENIKRNLKKLISVGFKPDLVIIDYFECLNHDCFANVSNDYDKEGKTMRKLEAMAGELNIALWIPSQGTKDSINLELVTMDKMGGSVKKAQIAHIILSIAKTTDDAANNKATLAVLKNRAGQSGKVFEQVEFNNGTCIVEGSKDTCNSSSLLAFGREQENKLQAKIFKDAFRK